MNREHSPDLSQAIEELGQIVLAERPLNDILETVVGLAKRTLQGRVETSVTLIDAGSPVTAAFTSDLALALDERQYTDDRGPCFDAAAAGTLISLPELDGDTRWPRFAAEAVAHGVRSSLSVPLPVQRQLTGALNFYAFEPHAFDAETSAVAETFAGHAAVAVANAYVYESTTALVDQMREAMATRAVI